MLKESLGSTRLGRKVDLMINKIEERLKLIEAEIDNQSVEQTLLVDVDG